MHRRSYLKTTLAATAATLAFPTIVPASVFGKEAPSNKVNLAQIGCGRIARSHDMPESLRHPAARMVAVCDVDSRRKELGRELVEQYYRETTGSDRYVAVRMYDDYRELLAQPDIDGVIISTPDHWHARPAIEAALAGKDIYLQKPTSLTVAEGRVMSDIVHRTGVVFQLGSQQRSDEPWPQFRRACELVRNGRIGKLQRVEIGLPSDPAGGQMVPMPVPDNLDYDRWLGRTDYVPYTLDRVHPQDDFSRPGWLRCEQFGAGMITGWGVHHVDIAHWGMDPEYTGPVEVEARATFPSQGLWSVHGPYHVESRYANGVTMIIDGELPNGVHFYGEDGDIFVSRGSVGVTASDPSFGNSEAFRTSIVDPDRLRLTEDDLRLYSSPEQHANWIESMRNRRLTVSPAEVAHRSCTACLISHIAMKLPRKLYWDAVNERFRDDDEANGMLSRPQRAPYGFAHIPGLRV